MNYRKIELNDSNTDKGTTVNYNNHNMIEFNEKLRYTPGMVYMTKTL